MAPAICLGADLSSGEVCRNNSGEVWGLQVISMVVIFLTSLIGISSPVILSRIIYGRTNHESVVLLIKCFSAGVILSTSLVHVLPDAYNAMGDCDISTRHPWRDFPFAGLVCAIGALLALFVDVVATSSHSHHHFAEEENEMRKFKYQAIEKGIVGEGYSRNNEEDEGENQKENEKEKQKQKMVSKLLEVGIIFHSVIIGVTMGMSQNRCTIQPLIAAVSVHQLTIRRNGSRRLHRPGGVWSANVTKSEQQWTAVSCRELNPNMNDFDVCVLLTGISSVLPV